MWQHNTNVNSNMEARCKYDFQSAIQASTFKVVHKTMNKWRLQIVNEHDMIGTNEHQKIGNFWGSSMIQMRKKNC